MITLQAALFLAENPHGEDLNVEEMVNALNSINKKRFDTVVAAIALFFLLPLLILISLAIMVESKGPIFFVQYRTGFMGRRFRMYKFRTMVENAETLKCSLEHLNFHARQSPDFKIKNDPRITRLGKFLRKTSFDEIPQLWNVIRGDMRLVGPRPTSFSADTYAPSHLSRLLVFPGLTGVWQIAGRSNVSFEERVRLDCEYILAHSAMLDLKILLKTPLAVFRGNGAY